jgi:MoaA/NifB/PqqE/SkfB family radical SAM enzyme
VLLPVLRSARSVGLHGAGEPLLYPALFELLDELDTSRTNVGFNSNGQLLTEELSRRLVEKRLGWISFSLDAATKESYLRIRRRSDFDRLLTRIEGLVAARRRAGRRRPEIEINMTLMRLNLPEAPAFVELASRLGVDRVMFQQIRPGGSNRIVAADGFVFDYARQELAGCEELHDEVMRSARKRAGELGIHLSYEISYKPPPSPPLAEIGEPLVATAPAPVRPVCGEPWRRLLVTVEGELFVCCIQMTNRVVLGRIGGETGETIEEAWNGRRAKLVRESLFLSPAPAACAGCYVTSGR